jgi:hypothetical protein
MASKSTYPCFACRKAGYEIPVYLDGKDPETGKTKYLNEDGSKHEHKRNLLEKPSEESVTRGMTAFEHMTYLIGMAEQTQKQVEQIHNLLASIDGKLDRLLNLAERK